jgi:hypothetical protein
MSDVKRESSGLSQAVLNSRFLGVAERHIEIEDQHSTNCREHEAGAVRLYRLGLALYS